MDYIIENWPSLPGQRIIISVVGGAALLGLLLLQTRLDQKRIRQVREHGGSYLMVLAALVLHPLHMLHSANPMERAAYIALSLLLVLSCVAFMLDIFADVLQAIDIDGLKPPSP